MMDVFPVSASADSRIVRRPDGRLCRPGIWYADTHNARRVFNGRVIIHGAQDIMAPEGSLVLAPEVAEVVGSSADTGPTDKGGHWLRLATDERVYYLSHLRDAPLVRTGALVDAGELVGIVGRTGNAARTCPHLHLGARKRRGRQWTAGSPINLFPELERLRTREVSPTTDPRVGEAAE